MANIKRITIGGDTLNLENYVESSSLAAVATSGSYADLINKPSIPTKTSDLTNDSNYQNATQVEAAINTKLASVMHYKGSVATYNELPTENLEIGDVYNVTDTGKNYAWNGTSWDELGGDIDLTEYYTKSQTDTLLSSKANTSDLSTVATSGSYNDLTNKPTITTTSQLTNDSGFITSSALAPYATTSQLAAKANTSDVYLKSDTNTFTMTVTNSSDTTTSYNLINVTGS